MSMIVASLLCVALLTVSLAHFLWAFGRRWPIRDRALLARTVIGRPATVSMRPTTSSRPKYFRATVCVTTISPGCDSALSSVPWTTGNGMTAKKSGETQKKLSQPVTFPC